MLELVREPVQEMEIGFAWHTGSVPVTRRRDEVRRFKDDPDCRLFLSTDSGGVGLNLQAANVVINLDLPWNPAKLEQRIARAWRKHQTRPVRVLHLVTEGTIEHRMIPLLAGKQTLADSVLDGHADLSEMPLPSGRRALIERLETLTGLTGSLRPSPGPPPIPGSRSAASCGPSLGDRLLRLETHPGRDGREILLAVVEGAVERSRIEALLRRHFEGTAAPPVLELLDRPAFEALERLIESGVLSFPAEDRRVLHPLPAPEPERDPQRDRRLAAARDLRAGRTEDPHGHRPRRRRLSRRGPPRPPRRRRARPPGPSRESEDLDLLDDRRSPSPGSWTRLPESTRCSATLRAEPGTLLGATGGRSPFLDRREVRH